MKCDECKGRLVDGNRGYWVCENCGLEHYQIMQEKNRSPFLNNNEMDYQKQNRERKMMQKQRQEDLVADFVRLRVLREYNDVLKKYCKERPFDVRDLLNKIVKEWIENEVKK